MGIKDILYTEKGKIISGILASVLISVVVFVPMSIFIDRVIRDDKKNMITSFARDSSKNSTGVRQSTWMEITGSGQGPESGSAIESTLVNNNNGYVSVEQSFKMFDGVKKSNGIAYLSNSSVSKDSSFSRLAISEDKGNTWIEPNDDSRHIKAPLNMVMKVPKFVFDILKTHMANSTPNDLNINDFNINDDLKLNYGTINNIDIIVSGDYGNFLRNEGFALDFALSFALFNYIVYAESAHEALLEHTQLKPVYSYSLTDLEFNQWFTTTFSNKEWSDELSNFSKTLDILVDGTETTSFVLDELIKSFNSKIIEGQFNSHFELNQKLNLRGSYGAWETTENNKLPPGVVHNPDKNDGFENGTPGAFLGTQSKGNDQNRLDFNEILNVDDHDSDGNGIIDSRDANGEIAYWGYSENDYTDSANNVSEYDFIYNESYLDSALEDKQNIPLGATMATDNIVFFTRSDLQIMNYNTNKLEKPTGITREGYRMIYEFGTTWNDLSKNQHIRFN